MIAGKIKEQLRQRLGHDRMLEWSFLPRDILWSSLSWLRSAPAPSRVAIVSMWDENQADLAAITGPNKAAYCARWGHHWIPHTTGFSKERPVAWSKLLFIRDALHTHDWVFWSDADSLITNPALPLAPFLRSSADLVITRDRVGYNSGSFLIRHCPWSFEFLQEAWDFPATDVYRQHYQIATDRLWENRAIDMLLRHRRHRAHVRIPGQRRLNSYLPELTPTDDAGAYQEGDFVLHLPGVPHLTRLRELASRAAALVC